MNKETRPSAFTRAVNAYRSTATVALQSLAHDMRTASGVLRSIANNGGVSADIRQRYEKAFQEGVVSESDMWIELVHLPICQVLGLSAQKTPIPTLVAEVRKAVFDLGTARLELEALRKLQTPATGAELEADVAAATARAVGFQAEMFAAEKRNLCTCGHSTEIHRYQVGGLDRECCATNAGGHLCPCAGFRPRDVPAPSVTMSVDDADMLDECPAFADGDMHDEDV